MHYTGSKKRFLFITCLTTVLAILVSAEFFLIAFFLLLSVNEQRGRRAALAHEGE